MIEYLKVKTKTFEKTTLEGLEEEINGFLKELDASNYPKVVINGMNNPNVVGRQISYIATVTYFE